MPSHSVAPWSEGRNEQVHGIIDAEGNFVCLAFNGRWYRAGDPALLKAAPDLLAAAKQALRECCDLTATPAGDALEAAIARAEGRS